MFADLKREGGIKKAHRGWLKKKNPQEITLEGMKNHLQFPRFLSS